MKRAGGWLAAWAAERYAERPALIFGDRRIGFRELHVRTNRLGNGLAELGLRKGDRVAVVLENSPEFVETQFALAKLGLVMVPVNVRLSPAERAFILEDSEAAAAVCDGRGAAEIQRLGAALPALRHVVSVTGGGTHAYEDLVARGSDASPGIEVDDADLELIRYTSGTTGRPKGAVFTVAQAVAQMVDCLLNLERAPGPASRMLHAAPLGHGSGTYFLGFYVRGAVNVVLPRFDVERVLETIARARVTHFYLVPTMLHALLDHPRLAAYDLSSLEQIFYGASPISERSLRRAIEVFGRVLRQQYGTSETGNPNTLLPSAEHVVNGTAEQARRLSSAGRASLGAEVRVVDEHGREVPRGQPGEIVVRRQTTMLEYWRQPEATARSLRDGWFHTGDIGVMDEDGYVFIRDRKSDMVISGGFNVYPAEVEQVLQRHPRVREAAVIGIPDPHWGESVKAYVVAAGDVTEAELIEWCKTHIASYKKPRRVEFVAGLPKSATGKVLRRVLKEQHEAAAGTQEERVEGLSTSGAQRREA